MKILFSVPTGYHLRELVLPLRAALEADAMITEVICLTPAAPHRAELFSNFSHKFSFVQNPDTEAGYEKLLTLQPADIVVTNTVGHDPLDYPLLVAAQKLNIKTLTFIASWDNVWKIERMVRRRQPTVPADFFIVWNTTMKRHLLRVWPHVSEAAVAVIGVPRLDYFRHNENIPTKQELYTYLNLRQASRPLIHVATTELYPMDYIVAAIREWITADNLRPAPYIYASVHPGGKLSKHANLQQYGVIVRYSFGRQSQAPHPDFLYNPKDVDIYMLVALFKHAAVLVNHSSSTALESLVAGTPVINVRYGRPLDWWRWYRSMVYRDFNEHYADLIRDGATYVVTNKQQLITSLKVSLADRTATEAARQKTVARLMTTTDGTAGRKVLQAIKRMATT